MSTGDLGQVGSANSGGHGWVIGGNWVTTPPTLPPRFKGTRWTDSRTGIHYEYDGVRWVQLWNLNEWRADKTDTRLIGYTEKKGQPDFSVTSKDWGTPTTPTPIADIQAICALGSGHGQPPNRMILSDQAYRAIKAIEDHRQYLLTLPWWHYRRVLHALSKLRWLWEVP